MLIAKQMLARFFGERFFDQAAQTAYYLLLSVIPFIIFMLSLLRLFPVDQESVLEFVRTYAPGESFSLITENVHAVMAAGNGEMLSLSFFSTFWLSSMAVQSLRRSLNDAHHIQHDLPFWKGLLRDFKVTLIFMIIVPLSLIIPLVEQLLHSVITQSDTIKGWSGWLRIWPLFRWGIGSLFLLIFFTAFYKIMPNKLQTILFALPGAFFASVSWQVGSLLFAQYAAAVNYTRLYGQLSGIIILVLWFYLTAVVILLGGLLNVEKSKRSKR